MSPFAAFSGRFSLRARLTALSVLGAVVVLPLGAAFLHADLRGALERAVTSELRIRADDVTAELLAGVEPVLSERLTTQVLDGSGTVLLPVGASPLLSVGELPSGTETTVDRAVTGIGDHARVLARLVDVPDVGRRYVVVAGSTASVTEAGDRIAVVFGIVGPLLVLAVAITAWVLTRAALMPVSRMTRRAATLSLEVPESRLPLPPGRDEIAELGATLNRMLDRIEETVSHERAFVDNASHELRTPIAVLRGELELARLELGEGGDLADSLEAIDSALEETDRLARVAENLLVLARADAGRLGDVRERVGLMSVTARVVDRVRVERVRIEVTGAEAHVFAEEGLVDQLVTNLVTNAARFARSSIRIEIRAADEVVLTVADDGPGFADEVLDRALDRFSRAGSSRNRQDGGAGLGLAIVDSIVTALGGAVRIANHGPLGGAVVEVRLPRAERAAG